MGFYNSPRIILDNLVLNLDAGNTKSYAGDVSSPAGTPYGYFTGGIVPGSPSESSISQRIDYDSDTTTTSPKGPLSAAKRMHSGTGSNSYGYLAGQLPNNTNADRIDYSNDTATATSKASVLVDEANRRGAVGNNSYGYWAGGTPNTTKISRLDYSNDSGGGVLKGYLTQTRMGLAGTGNASYGYFGGGRSGPSRYTTVDRLDYSSDSTTCVVKGPLTSARQYLAATGDTSYGYIAGGFTSSSYLISTIDRVDYSNDTVTAVTKGPLSTGRAVTAGASPKANALSGRSDNEGIISYSDTAGEENDTTCQFDTDIDGKVKFSGAAGIVTSTSATSDDTWTHAAVTRTDNTISVYINGVLENTGITTHTFSDYAKVTIGANRPRSTFYKGDISQVQIYKKSLSSDEIQQNFRSLKKRFGL